LCQFIDTLHPNFEITNAPNGITHTALRGQAGPDYKSWHWQWQRSQEQELAHWYSLHCAFHATSQYGRNDED